MHIVSASIDLSCSKLLGWEKGKKGNNKKKFRRGVNTGKLIFDFLSLKTTHRFKLFFDFILNYFLYNFY